MADERIGQTINRQLRLRGGQLAEEGRLQEDTLNRFPGEVANQFGGIMSGFSGAQQGVSRFIGDVAGMSPPEKPNTLRAAVKASATPATDRQRTESTGNDSGAAKDHTTGAFKAPPKMGEPGYDFMRSPGAGEMGPPEDPGRMRLYDTPKNPGSLSFSDRGGPDAPYTQVGLRQRAMQQAPEFDMTPTGSRLSQAANAYDLPQGRTFSDIKSNPLYSLSQAGLSQDFGVEQDREARYGGLREAALGKQAQELHRLQLDEQMKDPLGIEREKNTLAYRAQNSPEAIKVQGSLLEKARQSKIIDDHAMFMNDLNERLKSRQITPEQYKAFKDGAELRRDQELGPDFLKAMRKPEDVMPEASYASAQPMR